MKIANNCIQHIDVKGKKVLLRCDLNVPIHNGVIVDDRRIVESLPTIKQLLLNGAGVAIVSHLGRPKSRDEKYSLKIVSEKLECLLGVNVRLVDDFLNEDPKSLFKPGEVCLLENIRFYPEETENDTIFACKLASIADIFVNDAFGTTHRAHASTEGVTKYLPSYPGLLLEKELNAFQSVLESPNRPFVAILGGAKINDKVVLIKNLLEKVDKLLIGGGATFTFLKARGINVGKSLVDDTIIDFVKELLEHNDYQIELPVDIVVTDDIENPTVVETVDIDGISDGMIGVDIGPKTIEKYAAYIKHSNTVVWNGPMGIYEKEAFSSGTKGLAEAMQYCRGVSIVGGGDSAAALKQLGLENEVSHISTGGGAALELMEGKVLPGISSLQVTI